MVARLAFGSGCPAGPSKGMVLGQRAQPACQPVWPTGCLVGAWSTSPVSQVGSIMHCYVEAFQPVYTLYSNHCVSTVAYANRAFRSLAIQVLVSFWESLGIHFGHLFVIFQ